MVRRLPFGSAAVLAFAVLVALAVRVIPSYHSVITSSGVNFQDNDSWHHMRVAHNIAAHFPHQSGFDPYALFPGRDTQNTDPWDLFIATVAWLLGLGKPSDWLIDQVGAWLPAVLGALLPVPLFFLARRLFGDASARWTAIATAAIPGTLLWETHLGVPDHHVAECLLSVCAFALLCGAVEEGTAESGGRGGLSRNVVSGLLFGLCLCVRPAGIFVPATLAIAVLLEPVLAPFVARVLAIACAVFLLVPSGSVWTRYTWLTLAGCLAACLLAWALGALWRRRELPAGLLQPVIGIAAVTAIAIVATLQPAVFSALLETVRKYLPGGQFTGQSYSVAELIPLWEIPRSGPSLLFETLGAVWLPALPVLIYGIYAILSSRRPAFVLCAIWGLVMTVAGVLQMRMWVYGGPALAVAAGVGCAWLMAALPGFRTAISLTTAALLLATSIPHVVTQSRHDGGPGSDWRAALAWLRRNTPEPMGDAGAWLRLWPALPPGQNFAYPPSAYSVLTWWDYGDWVNAIAHRMPSTNGTQKDADIVAAYLTATSPELAQKLRTRLSARYAVLNSDVTGKFWDTILQWANRDPRQFGAVVFASGPSGTRFPVRIFLPDYYRSIAVRMFNFDGRAIVAAPEVSVFTTQIMHTVGGPDLEALAAEQKFPSEERAREYIASNPGASMLLGSRDPMVSPVNVEELTGVTRVFTSPESAGPQTVKVFELKP